MDDVDHAGHSHGFATTCAEYCDAVQRTDARVGTLLDALGRREGLEREQWLVLVTTDHGGRGRGHGDGRHPEIRTTWVVMESPCLK